MDKKMVIAIIVAVCVVATCIPLVYDTQSQSTDNFARPGPEDFLKFSSHSADVTIGYTITGSLPDIQMKYLFLRPGAVWTDWNGEEILLKKGETVIVKNESNTLSNKDNYLTFTLNSSRPSVIVSGDISSLINHSELSKYCYNSLFEGCESLLQAPELPETTLKEGCYYNMFNGCTGLKEMPDLPSKNVKPYCYYAMFYNCESLKETVELRDATAEKYCYCYMFCGCKNITKIGRIAINKADDYCCYEMFMNCSSLKVTNSGGNVFLRAPTESCFTDCFTNMFSGTAGSFRGTPNQYYNYGWYF